MTVETDKMKMIAFSFCIMLVFVFCYRSGAQSTNSANASRDEQTIRDLVTQENEGKQVIKFTDERIFVSGAYPKPIIGKEMSPENQQADTRMSAERQNSSKKSRINRLI